MRKGKGGGQVVNRQEVARTWAFPTQFLGGSCTSPQHSLMLQIKGLLSFPQTVTYFDSHKT